MKARYNWHEIVLDNRFYTIYDSLLNRSIKAPSLRVMVPATLLL